MEQDFEDQKVHAVDEIKFINKHQLLMKRILKFVVSVFLFSLFLCYLSSFGFCLFNPYSLNQFNVYFSTCLLSVFSHTLERKYMFLICNGILAFLAKSFISCSSTSTTSVNYESDDESRLYSDVIGAKSSVNSNLSEIKAAAVDDQEVPAERIGSLEDNDVAYVADHHQGELEQQTTEEEEEDGQQEEEQNRSLYTEKEEISTQALIAEDEEEGSESRLMKQQEEDIDTAAAAANDEDYLMSSGSTDELNKKFEEFIRKMKEEIRIEAQRQPIAV